jgi:xylono-1,5-lactonase
MSNIECVWEIGALLGEGPLWVEREQAVYWVDIFSNTVHRYMLADGARKTWNFDFEITSLSARKQGGFIGTIQDGYALIDLDNQTVEPIQLPESDIPNNRFNDGKVDAQGRYWAGTMDTEQTSESGVLYRLNADLSLDTMDENYIITNGPTFSKDGKTLYHTDTIKREIYAFDLSSTGAISNKRIFTKFEDESEGLPDGMTIDSEDCIWVCHFGGARITRYSPDGKILQVIPMPVPNITSCTFAGDNLDTLYITTARVAIEDADLHKYPLAGGLFSFKPDVKGLPTTMFAG